MLAGGLAIDEIIIIKPGYEHICLLPWHTILQLFGIGQLNTLLLDVHKTKTHTGTSERNQEYGKVPYKLPDDDCRRLGSMPPSSPDATSSRSRSYVFAVPASFLCASSNANSSKNDSAVAPAAGTE